MSVQGASPIPDSGPPARRSPTQALASAHLGSWYRITNLLFERVRLRCHEVGLREGDLLKCLNRGSRTVAVERMDGQRVELEREYARFVQVRETKASLA